MKNIQLFVLKYGDSVHSLPHCRDNSVWNLGHYHWAGRLRSLHILEQIVVCFSHCFPECVIFEVTVVSIKEQYLIVYRGGATCVGEFGHSFYPFAFTHITRWCVMEYPVH